MPPLRSQAALAGCATTPVQSTQDQFFASLSSHCGHTLQGRLATNYPQYASLMGKPVVGRFAECTASEVRIFTAFGEDTSRIWVISRMPSGLTFKHLHLEKDGSEAGISRYGGDAAPSGTAVRQEFPPDAFTRDLFTRILKRPGALTSIWAVEARLNAFYAYEIRQADTGRFFRLELHRRR